MDEGERGEIRPAENEGLDRRRFLNWSWKALGVALIVEAGWTSYDLLNPPASGAFGGLVDAGSVDDYMEEGAVRYFLDGRFYVTQHKGGLRALYQKCPHLGCRVPFCDTSKQFECPCHGSAYNIIGEYLRGPAPRGLDRFPISIEGDHVFVDTSSVVEGPSRGSLEGPSEPAGASCLETGGGTGADASSAPEAGGASPGSSSGATP
jgi:cytochrome b6-f complex iron-sulfur subunit